MQAIITKYIPPTNYKPSRVKAKCERGSITISWDYNGEMDSHLAAAQTLVEKFAKEDFARNGQPIESNPWLRPRVMGQLPGGNYAHVYLD